MKAKLVVALSVLALLSSLQGARAGKSPHGAPGSAERIAYCFGKLQNCKEAGNRGCRQGKDATCEDRVNKACKAVYGGGSLCTTTKN